MEYKNKYYWNFQIETSRFGGVMGASCDYVTEENREAWLRFVEKKSREVMKPETMDTQEFKECLMYVEEEKGEIYQEGGGIEDKACGRKTAEKQYGEA